MDTGADSGASISSVRLASKHGADLFGVVLAAISYGGGSQVVRRGILGDARMPSQSSNGLVPTLLGNPAGSDGRRNTCMKFICGSLES